MMMTTTTIHTSSLVDTFTFLLPQVWSISYFSVSLTRAVNEGVECKIVLGTPKPKTRLLKMKMGETFGKHSVLGKHPFLKSVVEDNLKKAIVEKVFEMEEEQLRELEDFIIKLEASEKAEEKLKKSDDRSEKVSRKRKRCGCERRETTNGKKRKRNPKGGEEDRKVKVTNLPVSVLENVFSNLNWKDLGTAMMVCRRWRDVGEHPSLWAGFPLQLDPQRLKNFAKIRRLDWVKSVTIQMPKEFQLFSALLQVLKIYLTRVEELYFFYDPSIDLEVEDIFTALQEAKVNTKLVRIGATATGPVKSRQSGDFGTTENQYFVKKWDASTKAFIKKTLVHKREGQIFVHALPELRINFNEVLEFFANIAPIDGIINFNTSLMIGEETDPERLANNLQHFIGLNWFGEALYVEENQKEATAIINAILDLLDSNDRGMFESFELPTDLLMKSHCLERLGGNQSLGLDGSIVQIVPTESGLIENAQQQWTWAKIVTLNPRLTILNY